MYFVCRELLCVQATVYGSIGEAFMLWSISCYEVVVQEIEGSINI